MSGDKGVIANPNADPEGGELDPKQVNALTAQVMNNPEVLAAMQSKLAGMIGMSSGYYDSLPNIVKRRVKALKNVQIEKIKIEGDFYKELHELEVRYAAKYVPLFEKRTQIVNGSYEPNDEEANYPSDEEEEEEENELSDGVKEKVKVEDKPEDKNIKGIPEFWLTILKNVDTFAENIQEHDEDILKHLIDIRVTLIKEPAGFKLDFVFSPNDYFTNEILTKEYELRCTPDFEDPWSYDGIAIVKCKGCQINWNKGKNVTEKTVTKKQKHKSKGQIRTVSKTVKNDSFFNFFDPPEVPEKLEDLEDETHALLQADWEMGELLRQNIVPRAVLFFTGEALDDYDEDYDEDEESEEDEEEDSDEDEDFSPLKGNKKGAK
ncbi:nucleosome assembly protein 1-like 1-B isoform X2 [Oppia nitens]|uniref:nucleosome assembly protein 1-like 1-B isoform X2 n=1 Tax=Oppia nitens TaxID=1686743 RepID=UPI0023D982B6|nr:nucleosome assembly protein 1-like 1-B isoform X2 [Oppia nitens]